MAKVPKRAKPKQLMALGFPKKTAKQAALEHNTARQLLKRGRRMLAELERPGVLAGLDPSTNTVVTLAQFAPDGVQHAGTVNWDTPAAGVRREPPGLDDAGRALHTLIANRAASTGAHYFDAMAAVTGLPDYSALSDIPRTPAQQGVDPQREAQDGAARALARNAGISWLAAWEYLDYLADLARLQGDDGSAPVPWLDTRPLSTPPRPWSDSENDAATGVAASPDSDWERDRRRAGAAGLDGMQFSKELWRAAAEQGRDLVGELAGAKRAGAIADLQARYDGFLDQARAAHDNVRSSAINDELQRRARQRVAQARRAGLPSGVTDSNDPSSVTADLRGQAVRAANGQMT
jgi:hypothetical protein